MPHPPQYLAKTFVLFKLPQILHTVSARNVQQHQGYDHLLICPTPLRHLKMTPDQLRQMHRLHQIQIYRQSRSCFASSYLNARTPCDILVSPR